MPQPESLKEPGFFEYAASIPKRTHEWWFGAGSPSTLGLIRILFGFLAFVNLVMIAIGFEDWFTEKGFVPQSVAKIYAGTSPHFNLLDGVTDTRITLAFYGLITLSAFLTCIGLWSRVSSAVLALGMVTLHHRNMAILHGGDVILRVMLIYLACAPSGLACSVDRWWGVKKGKVPLEIPQVSLWPQRLMQFQIALLYYTTVWAKWQGLYWRDGTASYFPMHLNEFDKFPLPDFFKENIWMIKGATYGTLLVELAIATIAFYRPLRKWALLGGVGLHLFIEYSMNIPLFAFIMISSYTSFYEGNEVSAWYEKMCNRFGFLPKPLALRNNS